MSGAEFDRAPLPPAPSPDAVRGHDERRGPSVHAGRDSTARVPDAHAAGFAAALEAAGEEAGGAETDEEGRPGAAARTSGREGEATEGDGCEEIRDEDGYASDRLPEPDLPGGVRPSLADVRSVAEAAHLRCGELAVGAVSAIDPGPADPLPSPSVAGATAPALDVAATGTLMRELRALDAPPSGQWRFAMVGNVDGLESLVLSRGESGAWNLRLGTDRSRGTASRGELDSLRSALRERGHDVDDIVQDADDGDLR